MISLGIQTQAHQELHEITSEIEAVVTRSGIESGHVIVFIPHTTAGVTINENADPTVRRDVLSDMERLVPWVQPYYQHNDGNSAAHLRSSIMGHSVTAIVEEGALVLGRWQGIYVCEFDGPRSRIVHVHVVGDA